MAGVLHTLTGSAPAGFELGGRGCLLPALVVVAEQGQGQREVLQQCQSLASWCMEVVVEELAEDVDPWLAGMAVRTSTLQF